MITPKHIYKSVVTGAESESVKIIYSDGKSENKGKPIVTNWHGSNLDPDSVSRHNRSLKRAGFQNNRHAKGVF